MAVTRYELELGRVCTPVLDTGGSSGEVVLFIHGNPGCGEDWRPLLERVAPFSRAIAPDLPGYGRAGKPQDFNYTIDGYAAHLKLLIDSVAITKVHLVLHDFGGPWGLAWAAANPHKIASISLFNIGVLPGYRWHYLARIWRTPYLGEIFQALSTRIGLGLLLKHGNPRGLPSEFLDRMYANLDDGTNFAVRSLYRATNEPGATADRLTAALRPLDLPALVIWGKADPYISYEFASKQKDVFPNAEIVYLDDSGHWPFIR